MQVNTYRKNKTNEKTAQVELFEPMSLKIYTDLFICTTGFFGIIDVI